ncbi:2-oxo-3-deoxygalactonate 6-phosphate aldolase [Gammaproteobacteria bacterium]|nr:2-oxo-3-deoxygalactonate 6-phosphate aldolase [Gammaproteobacteria bacterium]
MSSTLIRFNTAFSSLPLVAILRGIKQQEAVDIALLLYEHGFRLIEVPLNSPDPFASIEKIRCALPKDALVGAGTVLKQSDVIKLAEIGAELCISPNFNELVIKTAIESGLISIPGICTPSEAFNAIDAGSHAIKLFPAQIITPDILKALRAVIPNAVKCIPVGGVNEDNMQAYVNAGAAGFGFGSNVFQAGDTLDIISTKAKILVNAWKNIN